MGGERRGSWDRVSAFLLPPFNAMPMQETQLVGPIQGQGVSNITTSGLQQWASSQHGSINDGGHHNVHQQEHKATVMDFWSNSNDTSTSVLGTGGISVADANNSPWARPHQHQYLI